MDKNKVYVSAKNRSLKTKESVFVWENDWGEWLYDDSFPLQYSEIIAEFKNGEDVFGGS